MYKLPIEKSRTIGALNKKGKKLNPNISLTSKKKKIELKKLKQNQNQPKFPTETREELRMELDDLSYGISSLNKQLNQVDPGTPESRQLSAELNSYEKRYNKIKEKLK